MVAMKLTPYTKPLALTALSIALSASSAFAATTWTGAVDADIGNSANWNNGRPDNTVSNDGSIGLVGGSAVTVEMEGRSDMNGGNYTVSNGSTIHSADVFSSGANSGFRWGNSTLTLDGGHLDVDLTQTSYFGRGGEVTLNMNAGSTVDFVDSVYVGYDSKGVVNQAGGSLVVGGTLTLQYLYNAYPSGNIYNLTAGAVTLGGLTVNDRNDDDSNYFNFTTGSTGSLTIVGAASNYFDAFIAAGEIRINDATSTLAAFNVDTSVIGQATLSLVPEPSTYALIAGLCALGSIMIRRRR